MTKPNQPSEFPWRIHLGTQRAGSSYLNNLLRSHPDVALSRLQEPSFYTNRFKKGRQRYLESFPERGHRVDTSPAYFVKGRRSAPRIKELVPEARFSLILRDPVDYLDSLFHLQRNQGRLSGPERLPEFVERFPWYLDHARYHTILSRHWFSRFEPSQFKIFLFEEFVQDNRRCMNDLLEFWELTPMPLSASVSSTNRTLRSPTLHKLKSKAVKIAWLKKILKSNPVFNLVYDKLLTGRPDKLSPEERSRVLELLVQDIEELAELIGPAVLRWTAR